MEYADELVIEASVKQAQVGNGTSSWTTTTPTIILNEGDQIKTIGSWVSVPNSGENSIEIFDKSDSNSETVDASFKFSYYKTMDTKNVVAFPYHSIKLQKHVPMMISYISQTVINMKQEPIRIFY